MFRQSVVVRQTVCIDYVTLFDQSILSDPYSSTKYQSSIKIHKGISLKKKKKGECDAP